MQVADFHYDLPQDRIALTPASPRDASRLLCFQHGKISHHRFSQLPELLPADSTLFFNDTRVVPARLYFQKSTGAVIEIFLLQPVAPHTLIPQAMACVGTCTWQCAIGNLKRWTDQTLEQTVDGLTISVQLVDRSAQTVSFSWSDQTLTFSEVLHRLGKIPLPPYIHRELRPEDAADYQTVYSRHEGAVAAPTAGLHFTPGVLDQLRTRGIQMDFLTLHVSAGTFMPMKTNDVTEHHMHEEQVIVSRHNLQQILQAKRIIPVGTTSLRTLESVYWFGALLLSDPHAAFHIGQDLPYVLAGPPVKESITRVLQYLDDHDRNTIAGTTSIFIRPGYPWKVCKGLITNFHQPGSTLVVLIAALLGDRWREVYDEALSHHYRFLSFGDSSLLLP